MALARERTTRATEYATWEGKADDPAHAQDLAEHANLAWASGEDKIVEVGPARAIGIGVITELAEA
ncbi:hypothetical protein ACG83_10995 [Frankia sp. R43]|nr:hypothetical protein ACG83_10995 [Frankia sp. R43]